MIRFPCICKHKIEVHEDQAGGAVQCPRCGRLNDIPSLSDLAHISEDGTYLVEGLAVQPEPERFAELHHIYRKDRVDEEGNEIDLRNTEEQIELASGEEAQLSLADELRPAAPKYDPVTGELVRPIDLAGPGAGPVPQGPIPVEPIEIPAARRAISYATREATHAISPRRVFMELLMPVNGAVMLFVFLMHFLLLGVEMIVFAGLFFVAPIWFAVAAGIVAHYGTVVDEIGPVGRDELPRPLRQVSFSEDLWGPFCGMFIAIAVCYGPMGVMIWNVGTSPPWGMIELSLFAAGTFLWPAVLLTTMTSGTVVNLRPDRVLGVIRACGGKYSVAVLLWLICGGTYIWSILLSSTSAASFFSRPSLLAGRHLPAAAVVYPMLAIGVYLMHYFCWYVALLYRAHHDHFPWTLQHFVKVTPREKQALTDASLALKKQRLAERRAYRGMRGRI